MIDLKVDDRFCRVLCFEVLDEDDYSPAASKGSVVAFCGYVNLENWTWGRSVVSGW